MNVSLEIKNQLIKLNFDNSIDPSWLADCTEYLTSKNKLTSLDFYNQLVYSDLKDYSMGYTFLGDIVQNESKKGSGDGPTIIRHDIGYLFQIEDIEEIGSSNQAMLDAIEEITDKLVPTRIAPLGNDGHDFDQLQHQIPCIPRKVLKYTLTDGLHLIYAVETSEIPNINLFSPVGGKILVKQARYIRGLLKLNPNHVVFLGGSVKEMNSVPPLYRIASKCRKKLGIDEKKSKIERVPVREMICPAPQVQHHDQKLISRELPQFHAQESKKNQIQNPQNESTSRMDQIYIRFNHEGVASICNPKTLNQKNQNMPNEVLHSEDEYGFNDIPEDLLDDALNVGHLLSPVFNIRSDSIPVISNDSKEMNQMFVEEIGEDIPHKTLEVEETQPMKNIKRGRKSLGIIILSSSPIQKKSKKEDSSPKILKSFKSLLKSGPGRYKVKATAVNCHKISKLPSKNLFHLPVTLKDETSDTHTFTLQSNVVATLCQFDGPKELAAAREIDKSSAKSAGLAVLNAVKNAKGYFQFLVLSDVDVDDDDGCPKISISSLP